MLLYKDNTIQEPLKVNYFAHEHIYDSRDGWRVAFGLASFDAESDQRPFDESFGSISAAIKIWGEKDSNGKNKPT